ncbi:MAG: cytochrome C [Thioalkalispiraceae bacterium]|jgi:sulfide dehydrogenase cytochrome subunit
MQSPLSLQALIIVNLLLLGNNLQASGVSRGAMLSNSCSACHGTDGKSPGAIPSINGKSSDFISKALKDFRQGSRPSTVMGRHAKGYSDEEIQLIADYFSGL